LSRNRQNIGTPSDARSRRRRIGFYAVHPQRTVPVPDVPRALHCPAYNINASIAARFDANFFGVPTFSSCIGMNGSGTRRVRKAESGKVKGRKMPSKHVVRNRHPRVGTTPTAEKPANRFDAFDPIEREILRVLLNAHANAIGEISVATEARMSEYMVHIETLEQEAKGENG
jgi:hypothetical protein